MENVDIHGYFFDTPLYSKIKINNSEITILRDFLNSRHVKVDAYNPTLKENTTYSIYAETSRHGGGFDDLNGLWKHTMTCLRTSELHYVFSHFDATSKTLQKIGQHPSIADFHISRIKTYDKALTKEQLKEFTRAIGLAANGVGIGSFVYLRRIFEGLIEDARSKAAQSSDWNEEDFINMRMVEKISALANYLPKFLVDNKAIYSILSKGIHSLAEEECLAFFTPIKDSIELILDEKLLELERAKKTEAAQKRIAQINTTLSPEKTR